MLGFRLANHELKMMKQNEEEEESAKTSACGFRMLGCYELEAQVWLKPIIFFFLKNDGINFIINQHATTLRLVEMTLGHIDNISSTYKYILILIDPLSLFEALSSTRMIMT